MLCERDGDAIDSDTILSFEVFERFLLEVADTFTGLVERGADFGERHRTVADETETASEDVRLRRG